MEGKNCALRLYNKEIRPGVGQQKVPYGNYTLDEDGKQESK